MERLIDMPVDSNQTLNEAQRQIFNTFIEPQTVSATLSSAQSTKQSFTDLQEWKGVLLATIAYAVISSDLFKGLLSKIPYTGFQVPSIKTDIATVIIFAMIMIVITFVV
jgi:hypothetical protein